MTITRIITLAFVSAILAAAGAPAAQADTVIGGYTVSTAPTGQVDPSSYGKADDPDSYGKA